MPALPSFITYKPGRKTKAVIKSPFSLLRGESSTSSLVPQSPVNFASTEVIDINDHGTRHSLDFDGGKPIDESEKNLVDEEPSHPRHDTATSPQVQLDIDLSPEGLTDWFAANFLRPTSTTVPPEGEQANGSGSQLRNEIFNVSSSGGGMNGRGEGTYMDDDADSNTTSSEDVLANLQAMNPSHFGKLPGYDAFNRLDQPLRKKPSPNPITTSQPQTNLGTRPTDNSLTYKSPRPTSSLDTPGSSALSGTTLARALMSNTFALPDHRISRYRSGLVGLTRSDSMTLPRDSYPSAYDNDTFSIGPDAPAMPPNAEFIYEPPKKPRTQAEWREKRRQILNRRSSTGSLSTKALPEASLASTRPNSLLLSPGVEFDINSILPKTPESQKLPLPRSPLPPTPKHPYSAGADSSFTQGSGSAPESYQEATHQFPLDSQLISPDLSLLSPTPSSEGHASAKNMEDVLNYYSLPQSPDHLLAGINYRPAFSPISEESTSQLSPPNTSFSRTDKRDSQRSTPIGARSPLSGSQRVRGEFVPLPRIPSGSRGSPRQPFLLAVGERPRSFTQDPSPSSSQSASSVASADSDLLAPPPVSSIFNRQRAGSAPSPIKVVRDSKDANAYQITITPQISESGTSITDEGEMVVTQEFPETPDLFSPLLTTGTADSHGIMQSVDGHEVMPMPTVPQSANPLGRSTSQPSLAQQLLLNRAGTTVRHSPQTSIGKIKTTGIGGRSGSPSNRRIADLAQDPSSPIVKPELKVEGPESTITGEPFTDDILPHSPEEMQATAGPSNLSSAVGSRPPSQITSITDASSMYASSSESSKPRMKSLPAIPVSHSPVPSASASSYSLASTSPVPTPLPEPAPVPSAIPSIVPTIPPPPVIPPPSPTPSQKARAPPVRGRLPPALNINNSNISVAERAFAVNGADTNSENSPASFAHQELEIPAPPTPPAPVENAKTTTNQTFLAHKEETFTGRRSDIFRGTSLGSPPPYYTVVNEAINQNDSTPFSQAQSFNMANYGSSVGALAGPSTSTGEWTNSPEYRTSLARGDSSLSQRSRMRPPLPAGPRRPSQMIYGNFPPQRERGGSISSLSSNNYLVQASRGRSEASPVFSPKFQTPSPKWRGYTMEAAKWTFTSAQLQAIVSRAIRQSAEASSIRLLRLEVLDNEIPEEIQRLESQRTDLKTRYKVLTRKRATIFENLTSYLGGGEEENPTYALRLMEDLRELAITLDRLAEELHSLDGQLAHLNSLTHIHTSSALAMALRKLNASFLKQISENQALHTQIQALEAERDEAWQQAEFVANEYDRHMNDNVSSNRSSRVSAVRKSSIRVSKAGLRTPSQRLSQMSSHSSGMHIIGLTPSSARSPLLRLERIPPVPPIPKRRPFDILTDSPLKSSAALSLSGLTPTSETRALVQAQDELYAMLGLTNPERSLRRSLSFSMLPEQPTSGASAQAPLLSPGPPAPDNSWRRSSLPGDTALAETYNAMAADRNAILATIDMLSATD